MRIIKENEINISRGNIANAGAIEARKKREYV